MAESAILTMEHLRQIAPELQPGSAADRRHRWPQCLWDLQLLLCPVSSESSQQAVAVAVDSEHGGGRHHWPQA